MKKSKNLYSIDGLLKTMDELRVKCPWDKEQTMNSLKTLTIEETFELVDAINDNDYDEIKNELGDLLLHIIFYSKIASEKNIRNIEIIIDSYFPEINPLIHLFKIDFKELKSPTEALKSGVLEFLNFEL